MSNVTIVVTKGNMTIHSTYYTDEELIAAWSNLKGRGNAEARERGNLCVIKTCTLMEAVALSRYFVENVFAMPSCCHYDGSILSMYLGGAGGGYREARDEIERVQTRDSSGPVAQ